MLVLFTCLALCLGLDLGQRSFISFLILNAYRILLAKGRFRQFLGTVKCRESGLFVHEGSPMSGLVVISFIHARICSGRELGL
jgi:hypothetical protein